MTNKNYLATLTNKFLIAIYKTITSINYSISQPIGYELPKSKGQTSGYKCISWHNSTVPWPIGFIYRLPLTECWQADLTIRLPLTNQTEILSSLRLIREETKTSAWGLHKAHGELDKRGYDTYLQPTLKTIYNRGLCAFTGQIGRVVLCFCKHQPYRTC